MAKPHLTVQHLLQAGFEEVGCWELSSASDLAHQIDLPQAAAVYAFAIDQVVQYVGLASKSVRQRLGFYRKPAASQRTNVRLNDIIRGHLGRGTTVQILIAHPPQHRWNGLTIKGAEGLEAGLISEFDLPWNMRG
ncbi:MAG TPA: GIY-YIG nuclease family protein, partial [Sphingomicrobium sp.]